MTRPTPRFVTVAALSYRGAFVGGRLWISALLAALPAVLLAAFWAYGVTGSALVAAFGSVQETLVLSVQLPLTALLLGVGLFRSEIEDDTLTFLTLRTVSRPSIVVGKYLGGWAAALTFLLPSLGTSLAVALAGSAGAVIPSGYLAAPFAVLLLGSGAYLAVYLLIGLVTPSAVVVGLVYAFLWEFVLPLLPGHLPEITVYYYLRTVAADLTSAGPWGSYPGSVGLGLATVVPITVAAAALVLASVVIRVVETAPGRVEA
jgi:ABC-2 type transport system permease protein